MRFALPRPLKGWRAFAGEVGVIVLGVLIALGAGQVAEELTWRGKVREARSDLRDEIAKITFAARERIVVTPCLVAQLDRLTAALLVEGDTLRPVPRVGNGAGFPSVFRAPARTWPEGTWQSAVTDGVPAHLDRDERKVLNSFYRSVAFASTINQEETGATGALAVLAVPLRLDPGVRASLLSAVEAQRSRVLTLKVFGEQLIADARAMPSLARMPSAADLLSESGTLRWCRAHRVG